MARVSIVTATLNRPSLAEACRSVEAQTWGDWHHYVIGDGVTPTDHRHPQRTTIGFTTPIGAEEPTADMALGTPNPVYRWALEHLALGEFVCFLDDDNAYAPTFLEAMVTALLAAHGPLGIVLCGLEDLRFPKRGESLPSGTSPSLYRVDDDNFSPPFDGYPECGRCDNSAFLARAEAAKEVGFPRATPDMHAIQDYQFIRVIADRFGWQRVPLKLVRYGVGPNCPPPRDRRITSAAVSSFARRLLP